MRFLQNPCLARRAVSPAGRWSRPSEKRPGGCPAPRGDHRRRPVFARVLAALASAFLLAGCALTMVLGTGTEPFAGDRLRLPAGGMVNPSVINDFRFQTDASGRVTSLVVYYAGLVDPLPAPGAGPAPRESYWKPGTRVLREGDTFGFAFVRKLRRRPIVLGKSPGPLAGSIAFEAVFCYGSPEDGSSYVKDHIDYVLEEVAGQKTLIIPINYYGGLPVYRER